MTFGGGIRDDVHVDASGLSNDVIDDRAAQQLVDSSTPRRSQHQLRCSFGFGELDQGGAHMCALDLVIATANVHHEPTMRVDGPGCRAIAWSANVHTDQLGSRALRQARGTTDHSVAARTTRHGHHHALARLTRIVGAGRQSVGQPEQ